MRLQTVWACAGSFAIAALAGCNGSIGDVPSGSGGSGAGSGTGNTTGSDGRTGNAGGSSNPGTAGAGNTSPTGTGGTGAPSSSMLDLSGTPKYYRVDPALERAVGAGGPDGAQRSVGRAGATFETPVTGTTDFSNNELVLGFDSRNWQDFQSAAETLAAQVTATDAALAKVYSGTDPAGLHLDDRTPGLPPAADDRRAVDVHDPLQHGLDADGIAQHLRQGRVAGDPRDAAVAVLPVPDRARARRARRCSSYEMAAKLSLWLRGTSPDDKTLDLGGGHRQARHRGRRGGAGDDDAGRGGGDHACASSTASGCTSTISR